MVITAYTKNQIKARSKIRIAKLKRAFLILRFSVMALPKANMKKSMVRIKVGMVNPYFAIISFISSLIASAISVMMLRSTQILPDNLTFFDYF